MQQQSSRLIPKNVFVSHKQDNAEDFVNLKLPSSLRIQTKCFNPEKYEIEDPIRYIDEVCYFQCICVMQQKGKEQTKVCAIDSIIRWRYADDERGIEQHTDNLDQTFEIKQSEPQKVYTQHLRY